MSRFLLSFFVLLICSISPVFGQIDAYFSSYHLVDMDEKVALDISKRYQGHQMVLENPFTHEVWDIELTPSYLLSESYTLYTIGDDGIKRKVETSKPLPTKGYIKGRSESVVSLTFNEGYIGGFVYDGKTKYLIEPAAYYTKGRNTEQYIIYPVRAIKDKTPKKCGVDYSHKHNHGHTKAVQKSPVMNCYEVEWAIASDYQMFQMEGNSVASVENHNITVANDVQTNYDNEFADEIQFSIVEQIVISSAGGDPWTNSTDAGTLLGNFRPWGASNFGSHDIGSLWTGRDFDGGTIGIAYVGVVCTSHQYNCLQNFSTNSEQKRVMVAHEIGHNFNSEHDGQGDPYIMAPSVSEATDWSTQSRNTIETYYNGISCLGTCTSSATPPVASFTINASSDCAPTDVVFQSTSTGDGLTYDWTFAGGLPLSSSDANPTVSYQNGGTHSVTLTVTNAAGSSSATNTFDLQSLPTANFLVITNESTVTISDQSTGGTTYAYNFGDGNTSTEAAPVHTYAADGTYLISLDVSNACGTASFQQFVTIATQPVAAFSTVSTSGCSPLTVTYSNESTNASSYLWSFPGGIPSTSTEANPTVTYNDAGVFDVSLTATNGSGSVTEEKQNYITVSTTGNADFTYEAQDGWGLYKYTKSDASITTGILWDFGDGSTSTELHPVHIFEAEGTYQVSLTQTNSCGAVTTTQQIVQVMMVDAYFIVDNLSSSCVPGVATFRTEYSFPSYNYNWSFPGGSPATSTEASPMVTYSQPGTYSASLTITNSTGSNQVTNNNIVVVGDLPPAGINYTVNEQTIMLSGGDSALPYSWDFGDGNTSTEAAPTHTYNSEGAFEVTLTQSNNCGTRVSTETVQIVTSPVASIVVGNLSQPCAPSTVNYSSAYNAASYIYSWSFPGGEPAISSQANPQVAYNTPGTYAATLIVSNSEVSDTATLSQAVTILGPPPSGVSATGDGATYTFGAPTSTYTYMWEFGDGNTGVGATPMHTYTEEGSYKVYLTTEHQCGTYKDSTVVQYYNEVNNTISASSSMICPGASISFNTQGGVDREYAWVFEGGNPATSTAINPEITYAESGTYDVSLIVRNPLHADTIILTDYIEVLPPASAGFSYSVDGLTVNFSNTSTMANSYTWNLGDGGTSVLENPSHTYTEAGTYQVTLQVSGDCGSASIEQAVVVGIPPVAEFETGSQSGCLPLQVIYNNTSSQNATSFQWTFEGGSPSMSEDQNPTVVYVTPGMYDVMLVATGAAGSDTMLKSDFITVSDTLKDMLSNVELAGNNSIECSVSATGAQGYSWDFGDGTISSEQNPTHVYEAIGVYEVKVSVYGVCDTLVRTVIIDLNDTSVDEVAVFEVQIYPNPTHNKQFVVDLKGVNGEDIRYSIYDATGRVIRNGLLVIREGKSKFDLHEAAAGVYYISLLSTQKALIKKVVID